MAIAHRSRPIFRINWPALRFTHWYPKTCSTRARVFDLAVFCCFWFSVNFLFRYAFSWVRFYTKEFTEAVAVKNLILGIIIRQIVYPLKHQYFEHHHAIIRRSSSQWRISHRKSFIYRRTEIFPLDKVVYVQVSNKKPSIILNSFLIPRSHTTSWWLPKSTQWAFVRPEPAFATKTPNPPLSWSSRQF